MGGAHQAAEGVLAGRRITLRVGWTVIPPAAGAVARAAAEAERYDAAARLPGLPDELNPAVLDPARIEAFLRGLPRLAEGTLGLLEDRVLHLNAADLHLDAASPFDPGAIAAGYTLLVPEEPPGGLVQATLRAPIRPDVVGHLARRARDATEAADGEVSELVARLGEDGLSPDERRSLLQALFSARSRRFAAAMAWREATAALAAEDPSCSDAAIEAREAALRYVSPSWIGMPAPG